MEKEIKFRFFYLINIGLIAYIVHLHHIVYEMLHKIIWPLGSPPASLNQE